MAARPLTAAQAAAYRLLCTTPPERVRTHEQLPPLRPSIRKQRVRSALLERRRYIRDNLGRKPLRAIARDLKIDRATLRRYVRSIREKKRTSG